MFDNLVPAPISSPAMSQIRRGRGPGGRASKRPARRSADQRFVAMLDAYRESGGLARAQEVLGCFQRRGGPDAGTLANWIATRALIGFEWGCDTWLPRFQFDWDALLPRAQLLPVFATLSPVYDAWETACWFVERNPWLGQRAPVDLASSDLAAILRAAHADRFMASG